MAESVVGTESEGLWAFLFRWRRIRRRFRKNLGYQGSFIRPRDYFEKIQYRKLWGNHAFYASVADKYLVRRYVADRVGERYLIPLLGVHDRLTPDVFDKLPDKFVINTNHGSGWYEIVWDKRELDIEATCDRFNQFLQRVFGHKTGEYHYSLIDPRVLIVELLSDEGALPYDYNIFCYHSDAGFDYAIAINRPGDGSSLHFDRDWNLIEGELRDGEAEKYVNPDNFSEMLSVARALSSDFDFVRIDLYRVGGRIYFGEITTTPAAGLQPITNEFRVAMRARMWKMDVDNRLLYRELRLRWQPFWKRERSTVKSERR
jgi:hypothetical protein